MVNNEHKQIAKTINALFSQPNFYEFLCNKSLNDINLVIKNISKIINYYLVTKDSRISYSIEELLSKSNSITEVDSSILIHPSNSFYLNYYRVNGINPIISLRSIPKIDLERLDREVSLYPTYFNDGYSLIYETIEQALIESFLCPNILFKSILKQPKGQELPLVVGTPETNYYQNILDIRLKNDQSEASKTHAKIGQKAISSIVGQDSLLVLFPRQTKRYIISDKNLKDNETGLFIPPSYLSYIRIPSKYKLLSICANNKRLRSGELLNINTGEEYKISKNVPQTYFNIGYSRYEEVSITDSFIYSNSEFTGDIDYDIDLIYGQLDSNKSREKALRSISKNVETIKQMNDIIVRKFGNKYEIRNGRHRILYLKYFYVTNYASYQKEGFLPELLNYVTIPMNVESFIQDKTANEYLLKLYRLNPNIEVYKTNINNDDPNIIVVLNNKVYSLPNTSSIIEFYNYISNSNYDNKYYICENDSTRYNDYTKIFDYLVINLKEAIYNMDLLDIIEHLFNHQICLNNISYDITKLNIQAISYCYADLQHKLQIKRLFNTKEDYIKKTENKYKMKEIGFKIIDIILNNSSLIELSWDELYQVLITYPELAGYDEDLLKDSANYAGYQKLKLEYLYHGNNEYTKHLKV